MFWQCCPLICSFSVCLVLSPSFSFGDGGERKFIHVATFLSVLLERTAHWFYVSFSIIFPDCQNWTFYLQWLTRRQEHLLRGQQGIPISEFGVSTKLMNVLQIYEVFSHI